MTCEICELRPPEPGHQLCGQCQRLDHAVQFHGMNSHDCDCDGHPSSCPKCRGAGFFFSFTSTAACGPACPMGNPQ